MSQTLYDKRFLFVIRCISILCAIFLTAVEVIHLIEAPIIVDGNVNVHSLHLLIDNTLVIVLSYILALFPYKFECLAIASFYYGITCTVFEYGNPMGICMYCLGNVVLYARGYFRINPKKKIIFSVIFYVVLVLSESRFGISILKKEVIEKFGYGLVLSIILFLVFTTKQSFIKNSDQKNLNLADFPDLKEDDAILLKKVLDNKQYKEIAIEVFRTEGTVRNRLNKVYDVLGVMDKMGFVTKYTGYEIIYKTQDEIQSTSENQKLNSKSEEELYSELYDKFSSIFKKKK